MPQISVIVPVYKVEKYIHECVDSILAQTFSDFELILVDDGSPDNCGAICDEYAAKDSRVRVIHQDNQGLSGARNSGMDIAEGKFITFVDSDDIVHESYLETLYLAMDEDTDISICRYVKFEENIIAPVCSNHSRSEQWIDATSALVELYSGSAAIPINACGKLFRSSLISELRFPVGRLHEDQAFTPYACYGARKIVSCDCVGYFYRERTGSITRNIFSARRYDDLWAIDSCIRFFESKGEQEIVAAAKKKRQRLLSAYAIYAWRDQVEVPQEYRMNILKAVLYLRKNVADENYQYYLAQIHPRLALIHEYWRKIKKLLHLT